MARESVTKWTTGRRRLAAAVGVVAAVAAGIFAISQFRRDEAKPARPPTPRPSVCSIDPPDDEVGIQAAIRACPDGSRVSFPSGAEYHAKGPIRLDDRRDLVIDGNGSTFRTSSRATAPGSGNWVVLRGTNILFEDMVVHGAFDLEPEPSPLDPENKTGIYNLGRYPAGVGWETNSAWAFFGTDGGGVRDAQAFDLWGDGVFTAFDGILDTTVNQWSWQVARNLVIERIVVDNASRACVGPTQTINNVFRDSTFRNCWSWGVNAEADADPTGNLHNRLPIDGLRILNNTFEGYNFHAISVPVGGDADTPVARIEIRGNRLLSGVTQQPCGASILVGGYPSNTANRFQDVTIADNTIHGLTRHVALSHVDGGSITGNVLRHKSYGLQPNDKPSIQCQATTGNPVEPVAVTDSTEIAVSSNTGP